MNIAQRAEICYSRNELQGMRVLRTKKVTELVRKEKI